MSNAFSQSDLVLGIKTSASQLLIAFVLIVFYYSMGKEECLRGLLTTWLHCDTYILRPSLLYVSEENPESQSIKAPFPHASRLDLVGEGAPPPWDVLSGKKQNAQTATQTLGVCGSPPEKHPLEEASSLQQPQFTLRSLPSQMSPKQPAGLSSPNPLR